jgi:hypothetical protein
MIKIIASLILLAIFLFFIYEVLCARERANVYKNFKTVKTKAMTPYQPDPPRIVKMLIITILILAIWGAIAGAEWIVNLIKK